MAKIKILYIEGNEHQRKEGEALLRKKNFEIVATFSGEDALQILESAVVDAVLCELNLPGISGLDLLERVKEMNPAIPFILLAEDGTISQAVKAIKQGAFNFLQKPFDVNKLAKIIRDALRQKSSQEMPTDPHALKLIRELEEKTKELERKTFSLGMANIDMLAVQERLEEKNRELENVLTALSQRTDELQAILDTSPSAIVMIDRDGKITAANQRLKDFFGVSRGKVLHRSFKNFISKIEPCFEDLNLFRQSVDEIEEFCRTCDPQEINIREMYSHALRMIKPRTRIVVPLTASVNDQDGNALGQIWIYNDITELKRTDELLRTIVEASPYPIIVSRFSDGEILFANEPTAEILGTTPSAIVGLKTPGFYADPEDRQKILKILAEKGVVRDREVLIRKFDGETVWMIFALITTELDGEKVVISALYDIDARRKAEEALRESEERFRQLTENINEAFWMHDVASRKPIYISPAMEDITGLKPEVVLEDFESTINIIHPEDRDRVTKEMNRQIIKEYDIEYRVIRPDGEVRWIFERAFPIFNESGEVYRVCGVVEDITERKLANEALTRERNFVSAVLDTAGALVIVLDIAGRIVRFNRACEEVTGYKFKEVKGKIAWDIFIIPEERERVETLFRQLKAGEYPNEGEIFWLTKDGNRCLVAWSNTVLTNNAGAVEYIIGTGIDITERKKAEDNLRLYRKIFMNSNDSIAILAPNGKILEVNPAAQKLYGYSEEELTGQTTALFMGEKNFSHLVQSLPDKGNYSFRKEMVVSTKDGKDIAVELSAFPILNEKEEVIYRIGFVRDITKRKQAEEALRKAHDELEIRVQERTAELAEVNETLRASEARNTALLNAIPDLMFRLSSTGIYRDYKAPNDSDLALPPEQVIGRTVHETMPPGLAEAALKHIHRALDTGEPQVMEYDLPHLDHLHHFEARLVVSGKDEIIAIVRDITDRKAAEEALRRAHDELETRVEERTADLARTNKELQETQAQLIQSEKMAALGTLVAGIAHEINTPVGAINSMHNTLVRAVEKLKSILDGQITEGYTSVPKLAATLKVVEDANRVIASGSERVTTIVRRLRSFARLDEAELKDTNIHEGIEDTLVLIYHEIKHNINVVRNFGKIPTIACYPGKLNQVVLNLLINARQAMQDKADGVITISTWHKDRKVYISIADNGVGIPPQNLHKIFDPGFTTKGVGIGTGLGLSIVYRIIREDHRGEIKVESEVGKGTTFTIIIPDNLFELVEHT